jgi:hypothetical protein
VCYCSNLHVCRGTALCRNIVPNEISTIMHPASRTNPTLTVKLLTLFFSQAILQYLNLHLQGSKPMQKIVRPFGLSPCLYSSLTDLKNFFYSYGSSNIWIKTSNVCWGHSQGANNKISSTGADCKYNAKLDEQTRRGKETEEANHVSHTFLVW